MKKRIKLFVAVAALLTAGAVAVAQSANDRLFNAVKNGTAADVRAAIKEGANVNAWDGYGFTALMLAARYRRDTEVIKILVAAGADVNARDRSGWTALMCAAFWNTDPDVVKALIGAGANVNARDNNGRRAFDYLKDR